MEKKVSKKLAKFKVDLKRAIYYYLQITKPMHKLSNVEMKLLTEVLHLYVKEKPNFVREEDVWRRLFSKDSRADIRENLDMGKQVFENYMTSLRKKKVIINNEINPVFNPIQDIESNIYEITFRFEIQDRK